MNTAVYAKIAEEIALQARRGEFRNGEKFFSRRELCERYGVSPVTAARIQSALQKKGIIRVVKGNGAFIQNLSGEKPRESTAPAAPPRRLVDFYFYDKDLYWVGQDVHKGIERRALELGAELRIERVDASTLPEEPWGFFPGSPEDGYILIAGNQKALFALASLLLSYKIRSVFVDYVIPGSHCVLSDTYSGVAQALDFLESRGHREVLYASRFFKHLGHVYEDERKNIFQMEVRHRPLRGTVIESGDFGELLDILRRPDGPSAVMFSQDEPAIRLKRFLKEEGVKRKIQVVGYDDFSRLGGLETLTTVRVDRDAMGRAAVDLLVNALPPYLETPKIVRTPCELIVRD